MNDSQTYLQSMQQREVGTYNPYGDNQTFSYYDTLTIAHGTPITRFFTQGLGVNGKTLADTNMNSSGQIPRGQKFIVHAIKTLYTTPAVRGTTWEVAFMKMLEQTTVEMIIANKSPILQACLNEMMHMPLGVALTPTAAGDNLPQFSVGKVSGVYPLGKNPIVLAELTSFELRATFQADPTAAVDGDRLKFVLCGELQKAS